MRPFHLKQQIFIVTKRPCVILQNDVKSVDFYDSSIFATAEKVICFLFSCFIRKYKLLFHRNVLYKSHIDIQTVFNDMPHFLLHVDTRTEYYSLGLEKAKMPRGKFNKETAFFINARKRDFYSRWGIACA